MILSFCQHLRHHNQKPGKHVPLSLHQAWSGKLACFFRESSSESICFWICSFLDRQKLGNVQVFYVLYLSVLPFGFQRLHFSLVFKEARASFLTVGTISIYNLPAYSRVNFNFMLYYMTLLRGWLVEINVAIKTISWQTRIFL